MDQGLGNLEKSCLKKAVFSTLPKKPREINFPHDLLNFLNWQSHGVVFKYLFFFKCLL